MTDIIVTRSDVMTNIMLIGGPVLSHCIFGPDVIDHFVQWLNTGPPINIILVITSDRVTIISVTHYATVGL